MLDIGMDIKDDVLTVTLDGELDGMSFPEFEELLESRREEVNQIIIDAAKLKYVSSAGLRVIMSTEIYMESTGKEKVKLINPSDDIVEIIELCGFDQVIEMGQIFKKDNKKHERLLKKCREMNLKGSAV